MRIKPAIWKFLTFIVFALLILNPETVGLALLIDSIGLEIFVLMVELQIVALFGVVFHNKIKPAFSYIRRIRLSAQFFHSSSLAPAASMQLLVLSSSLPLMITCLT